MTSGLYLNTIAFTFYAVPSNIITYLVLQLAGSLQQTIFWLIPPFMIQILLANFRVKCNSRKIHLLKNCIECMDEFESFSKALNFFLIFYFMLNQNFAIFFIFATLRAAMKPNLLNLKGALFGVIGQGVFMVFVIYALIVITGTIDESFENLKGLKRPIQETLLRSNQESEKSQMKYLLQRIEDIKPMSACGYFQIEKSTLTSMLSVRLVIRRILVVTFKYSLQLNLHYHPDTIQDVYRWKSMPM